MEDNNDRLLDAVRLIMPWVNYAAKGFNMRKREKEAIATLNEAIRQIAKSEGNTNDPSLNRELGAESTK